METKNASKVNFTLKSDNSSYDFTILENNKELTLKIEDLKEFPIKIYELKIEFEKLKQIDDNFFMFKTSERFINAIKSCIQSENYSISIDKEENAAIFLMKNDFFDNGGAKIKIPEKEQDLKSQVEALTKIVSEMKNERKKLEIEKDEAAVKSFQNTSFLKDDEKKLIVNGFILIKLSDSICFLTQI